MNEFNGLICDVGTLPLLANAQSRSLTAENITGAKGAGARATKGTGAGCARDLGLGWKISPSVAIEPGTVYELGNIEGPGAIQSMWMAGQWHPRFHVLRIYWDDQAQPSVECPLGDFFCNPLGRFHQLTSQMVCLNPGANGALNCYWPMPFRKRCRITIENRGTEQAVLYYQVNYALGPVPENSAYFHAQFRRSNPLAYKEVHTLLDGVSGHGHYAGTYMLWGVNNNGWWGEGEIKFYLDGDGEFPTICGTGTEDYFCGCYNFENYQTKQYQEFCTPYAGLPQIIRPDGLYSSQQRFGMYRWHIPDPIRFQQDLRVTTQALGWRSGRRYLPLQDDIASVAYWYQTLPTAPFPELPTNDMLEII
jgi:hypothetical protein